MRKDYLGILLSNGASYAVLLEAEVASALKVDTNFLRNFKTLEIPVT